MKRPSNGWDEYPDWSRLEESDLQLILARWESLLARPKSREESLHAFLSEHAQLAFWDDFSFGAVISKLRLGAELVTDFVAIYDNWSNGIRYKLIEIETPQTVPFTKEGIPSSGLSRAIQQVLSWRQWLDEHRSEAGRLFPSYFHRFNTRPVFQFEIIIGNRTNSEPWLDRRRTLAESLGISIRSFATITPRFKRTVGFTDFSNIGDERSLDLETRNRLACPFCSALSDPDWREMVRRTRRAADHFMGCYGEELVKFRRENAYAARFRRLLKRRKHLA